MENLTTFEEAATSLNIDPTVLPIVTGLPENQGKAIIAAYKLFVISQAAWKGKKIDWNSYEQRKYYPWFDMETYPSQVGSGSGFSCGAYVDGRTFSDVGSRLVFPTSEIAKFVGKTHLGLYRDLMVIE